MNTAKDAAQKIIDIMKQTYRPYTYLVVNSKDFIHLDIKRYDIQSDILNKESFSGLLDIEILEITNQPHSFIARTFIRTMVSNDETIASEYYQVQPRLNKLALNLLKGILNFRLLSASMFFLKSLKRKHCYGFETELNDGSFIITSNAEDTSKISSPSTIDCVFYTFDTPVDYILARHRERIAKKISDNSSLACLLIKTKENFLDMQHRLQAQKISHRLSVDLITRAELDGLSDSKVLAEDVYVEVQKKLSKDNFEA